MINTLLRRPITSTLTHRFHFVFQLKTAFPVCLTNTSRHEPEPMNKNQIQKRFDELEKQYTEIEFTHNGILDCADRASSQKWATSAQHLIKTVFAERSPHYENFTTLYTEFERVYLREDLQALRGTFDSAKADYEVGYISDLESSISGELLGDFVVMAKEALKEGHKDVAAVLACAALEDALKRFARSKELDVDDKPMKQVVNALKSEGLVSGSEKALLNPLPSQIFATLHFMLSGTNCLNLKCS